MTHIICYNQINIRVDCKSEGHIYGAKNSLTPDDHLCNGDVVI